MLFLGLGRVIEGEMGRVKEGEMGRVKEVLIYVRDERYTDPCAISVASGIKESRIIN